MVVSIGPPRLRGLGEVFIHLTRRRSAAASPLRQPTEKGLPMANTKKVNDRLARGQLHRLVRCLVQITEQRTKNLKILYPMLQGSRMIMQLSRDYDPLFSGGDFPQGVSHAQPASGRPSRDQGRVADTAQARGQSKRRCAQRAEHDAPSKQRPACRKTASSGARRPTSSNEEWNELFRLVLRNDSAYSGLAWWEGAG